MKLTIGHLFYDLLNLYGENGNIMALKHALETQGIQVDIKNLSIDTEPWDINELDIIYIGAGTENNLNIALSILNKYKEDIEQLILNNTPILATGNSIELFGKAIICDSEIIKGLNIFDYTVTRTRKRQVSECIFNYDEIQDKILGFENHGSIIDYIKEPLFTVEKGYGYNINTKCEGIKYKRFMGTYLLGPLLVRNPELLEKICKETILLHDSTFKFKDFDLTLEKKAHNNFLNSNI